MFVCSGIHGRQSLTPTKDEKFGDDARPVPTPRQRHPQKEDMDDVDGRYDLPDTTYCNVDLFMLFHLM